MGLFNVLNAKVQCPVCKELVDFRIQFKYGYTRQLEYELGEILKWDGQDIGEKGVKRVKVQGIGEDPCSKCRADFLNFEIEIKNDRIDNVIGLDHEKEYHSKEGDYEIIEE